MRDHWDEKAVAFQRAACGSGFLRFKITPPSPNPYADHPSGAFSVLWKALCSPGLQKGPGCDAGNIPCRGSAHWHLVMQSRTAEGWDPKLPAATGSSFLMHLSCPPPHPRPTPPPGSRQCRPQTTWLQLPRCSRGWSGFFLLVCTGAKFNRLRVLPLNFWNDFCTF